MKDLKDKVDFLVGLTSGILLSGLSTVMFLFGNSNDLISFFLAATIGFFGLFCFCFAYGGCKGWK